MVVSLYFVYAFGTVGEDWPLAQQYTHFHPRQAYPKHETGKSNSKNDGNEHHPTSERSNSRASKASIEHYDKRILNISKLSTHPTNQKKNSTSKAGKNRHDAEGKD